MNAFKKVIRTGGSAMALLSLITSCSYPAAAPNPDKTVSITPSESWKPPSNELRKVYCVPFREKELLTPTGTLALGEVIDFTLSNNPQTELNWALVKEAAAQYGLSAQSYWPTINFNGNITRTRGVTFLTSSDALSYYFTAWSPGGSINWTLWNFGAREAGAEYALQALFSQSWSYNQELQTLMQEVIDDYYDLLYQKALVMAKMQDVADAKVSYDAARKKLETGVVDLSDVLQAQTQLLQTEVDLVQQRQDAENSMITLVAMMGLPANKKIEIENFPAQLPGREYLVNIDKLIEVAKNSRPEILSAKANVLSQKAGVREAQQNEWPVIAGNFQVQDYLSTGTSIDSFYTYSMQFTLTFPIFAGYYYKNQIRLAKANLKQAEANLKALEDQVLQDVATAYNDYSYAQEKVVLTKSFLDAAAEEFQVILGNYKQGTDSILDLLNAQTQLSNARAKYIGSIKDIFVSLTDLAYSTGALIKPELPSESPIQLEKRETE